MSVQIKRITATGNDGKTYIVIEKTPFDTIRYSDGSSATVEKLKSYTLENGDTLTPVETGKFKVLKTNVIVTITP